jgi:transcriptional regulator with XRE-family HTH domain
MDAIRLGLSIRALRRRRGWTQGQLGERVGLSASEISRTERGAAHRVPIRTLEPILEALGARLYVRVLWRGEELDRLLDHDHAVIVERVLALLGLHGWTAIPEATFQVGGERGSIDILAWHEVTRTLLVIEVKSVVPDVQPTVGGLDRKTRIAPTLPVSVAGQQRASVDCSSCPMIGLPVGGSRPSARPSIGRSPREPPRSSAGWRGRLDPSLACCSCQICPSLTLVTVSGHRAPWPRTDRPALPDIRRSRSNLSPIRGPTPARSKSVRNHARVAARRLR